MIHQEGGVQELAVTDFQAAEEGLDGEAEGAGKGSVVSQEWFTTKDDKTALQSQGKARKKNCSCCSVSRSTLHICLKCSAFGELFESFSSSKNIFWEARG